MRLNVEKWAESESVKVFSILINRKIYILIY